MAHNTDVNGLACVLWEIHSGRYSFPVHKTTLSSIEAETARVIENSRARFYHLEDILATSLVIIL